MLMAIAQRLFTKVLGDEKGVTSLEYAVLGVFLVVAIIAAVTTLSGSITSALGKIGTSI